MTERIDATNATEHMADAESTAESAKAAVRGVEETRPEYVDFTVDDFPGGLPACLEAILMVADQPQTATELARILALDRNTVEEALRALHDDYEAMNPVASAARLRTAPHRSRLAVRQSRRVRAGRLIIRH